MQPRRRARRMDRRAADRDRRRAGRGGAPAPRRRARSTARGARTCSGRGHRAPRVGRRVADPRLREINFGEFEGRAWATLDAAVRSEIANSPASSPIGGETFETAVRTRRRLSRGTAPRPAPPLHPRRGDSALDACRRPGRVRADRHRRRPRLDPSRRSCSNASPRSPAPDRSTSRGSDTAPAASADRGRRPPVPARERPPHGFRAVTSVSGGGRTGRRAAAGRSRAARSARRRPGRRAAPANHRGDGRWRAAPARRGTVPP